MDLSTSLQRLHTAVSALMEVDVDGCPPAELASAVVTARRLVSQLDAVAGRLAAKADAAAVWVGSGERSMAAWLAVRTGTSTGRCRTSQSAGEAMAASEKVADAVRDGELSAEQAAAIASAATHLNFDDSAAADLLDGAGELSPGKLRERAEEWTAAQDRDAAIDVAARQRSRRSMTISRMADGMYSGRFLLDPESGARVKLALEAQVHRTFRDGSGRTREQRMADALVDIADFAATRDERLGRGRRRPTLLVDVDHDVLFERAAGNGHAHTGDVIDPGALQRLMCDADLHRVVTKGRSIIHDMGAKVALAPEGLYLALVVRDRGCRWPGCEARASWCEVHHIVPRQQHGPTNQTNCVLLCPAHHTLTHDAHWQVRGTGLELHVTGPDRRTRTTRPPRARPPTAESRRCPATAPQQLQLVS